MKRIVIIIMCSLLSLCSKAEFIQGQKLYVLAQSGLKLRTAPVIGSTINVIPFNAEVRYTGLKETSDKYEIDWVAGGWIEVEYEGQTGFVFDGYLTDLPLPSLDFEKNQFDMELFYPVESWVKYRFLQNSTAMDTMVNSRGGDRVTQNFEGGQWIKEDRGNIHKTDLYLNDTRIMDLYQILKSMYEDPTKQKSFENNTVFMKDEDGLVNYIKIGMDELVTIRKLYDGQIRLRILTSESGCE